MARRLRHPILLPVLAAGYKTRKSRNVCCGPPSSIVSRRGEATIFDEASSFGRRIISHPAFVFSVSNGLKRLVAAHDMLQGPRSTSTLRHRPPPNCSRRATGKHWHQCRTCGEYFECHCNNRAKRAAYCCDCTRLRQAQSIVDAALFQILRSPITRN